MATTYCADWLSARNAANDYAGVGGRVLGFKEGFVAVSTGFTRVFIVRELVTTEATE